MRKNYLKIAVIVIIIASLSGCAELRRKFIRKKKPKKIEHSFYSPTEYQPKSADERYRDHYVFWHNWQLDLERMEGTSHKRDVTAINEALRHLTEMRDLLKQEKADELDIQVKKMQALAEKLKNEKVDFTKDLRSRKTVERTGRVIVKHFSYKKMKGYIIGGEEEKNANESEE